ncbi:hypothetical protein B7C62_20780 [Kitasatospora albolonga]|uniref:Uncharacterized protein n=1 Tax=Kitasatospora albolonga TaxID=68173 RepID=A0ABC8BVN1_9ACTN|nr:hypothetical protein B7C62_20780 [Kitasatospora albolonga]
MGNSPARPVRAAPSARTTAGSPAGISSPREREPPNTDRSDGNPPHPPGRPTGRPPPRSPRPRAAAVPRASVQPQKR